MSRSRERRLGKPLEEVDEKGSWYYHLRLRLRLMMERE